MHSPIACQEKKKGFCNLPLRYGSLTRSRLATVASHSDARKAWLRAATAVQLCRNTRALTRIRFRSKVIVAPPCWPKEIQTRAAARATVWNQMPVLLAQQSSTWRRSGRKCLSCICPSSEVLTSKLPRNSSRNVWFCPFLYLGWISMRWLCFSHRSILSDSNLFKNGRIYV